MTKRIKIDVPDLTKEDVVRISGEVAAASIELDGATATMNAEIDNIRKSFADRLGPLSEGLRAKTAQLERWASAHPELFRDVKSMDMPRAVIGFRTGQPQVKMEKNVSQADAIENLLRIDGGDAFVRVGKPSLDKDAILKEREALADLFSKAGITFIQEERFYIEPKKDQPAEVTS